MSSDNTFERIAVLGAGIMGAQLAAVFADKGIKTYLFDISNELATNGKNSLKTLRPTPLESPENINLITPCSYKSDIENITQADWVLEAVAENLDIKLKVYDTIFPLLKKSAILTTNTSGLTLKELSQKFSLELKNRFMVSHFFNPPRYMHLLELIRGEETSSETYNTISNFGKYILGKGIVPAKDCPNFIGNRVGIFGLMSTINIALKMEIDIEIVDALTGSISGRPKSATFRTADIIGLDVLKSVAMTTYKKSTHDESIEMFKIPEVMKILIANGNLGQKAKSGFYKKDTNGNILVFDLDNKKYRSMKKVDLGLNEEIVQGSNVSQQINALINLDSKYGKFFWEVLSEMLLYCANRVHEISDSYKDIDNAMKWGFGWRFGPFEIWDMIGFSSSIERMKADKKNIPEWLKKINIEKGPVFY